MELNPYLHDLAHRERSADAMRDAERWRLIRSLREQRSSRGWLGRLRLKRLASTHHEDAVRMPVPGAHPTASSSTP
jgi:hypothetical protein